MNAGAKKSKQGRAALDRDQLEFIQVILFPWKGTIRISYNILSLPTSKTDFLVNTTPLDPHSAITEYMWP